MTPNRCTPVVRHPRNLVTMRRFHSCGYTDDLPLGKATSGGFALFPRTTVPPNRRCIGTVYRSNANRTVAYLLCGPSRLKSAFGATWGIDNRANAPGSRLFVEGA